MVRSLYTAATGMTAQQLNMDVIANNLANVNTTGFKKSRADFQDLLYQNSRTAGTSAADGAQVPTGILVGLGTRTAAVERLNTQGDAKQTGNALDMEIEGDGFFQIQLSDGPTGYTRDGSFKLDSQGRIVTSDGYPLQPELVVPKNTVGSVTIAQDGTVSATVSGSSTPQEIGKIQLARFSNASGLESVGRDTLKQSASSGDPTTGTPGLDGLGTLGSGFLEMSNVSVVEEMVNMITAQRAYEINSKAIQASDEMLQMTNQMKK